MSGSLFTQDPRTKSRNAAERRFRAYGLSAIVVALLALVWLLISIFSAGTPAFRQTFLTFPVTLDAAQLDKAGNRNPAEMAKATTVTYGKVLATSLQDAIAAKGIDLGGVKPKQIAEMISQESAATLRNKVLADPARLRLLSMVAAAESGEACACDLVEPIGRSQPTVSHHLSLLVDAGLLTREKRGKWAWYRIVPERLDAIRAALGSAAAPALSR